MAKSKPAGEQEPKVEVRLHWQPRGSSMESQLLDQPLYAHLPWTGDDEPEHATTTRSLAGRSAENTDTAWRTKKLARMRPPVVVAAQAEPGLDLRVRFQFLHHRLEFKDGRWQGSASPAKAEPSAWLAMAQCKPAAAPKSGPPASSALKTSYYSDPVDVLDLVQWLEGAPATSSVRLASSSLQVLAPDAPILLQPGLASLTLLTGDGRDATRDPPGILPVYEPLRHNDAMRLPPAGHSKRRPLRIAWVHTEEYWRDPAQDGRLRAVFPAADTARVFAANLGTAGQFVQHGGAMLGRFAKIDPEHGEDASCGGLGPAVNIDTLPGAAATAALRPLEELTPDSLARPWPELADPRATEQQRHRAAIVQPSAKQVLLCGGLMAIRAEVAAMVAVAADAQGPPEPNSLGTFDFLVRHPADVIYVLAHQISDSLAVGRVGTKVFRSFLNIPAWLNALESDRKSTRAPWVKPLPAHDPAAKGRERSAMPQIAPILALMSCDAVQSPELGEDMVKITAPAHAPSKHTPALSAVFAAHGTRPAWEFSLPFGSGSSRGTPAMIGLQAALAGRAIGAVLAEVLERGQSCAEQRGRRARWTTNERIRRAILSYAYWTGVLSSGEGNIGFVYSIWGNLDPERAVPGLAGGIPYEFEYDKFVGARYLHLEAEPAQSTERRRRDVAHYQGILTQLIAARSAHLARVLATTKAFTLEET